MIFLTQNKNDNVSKQVVQDFPMVLVIEISDPNISKIIANNENLYLDWRLSINQDIILLLNVIRGREGYKILEHQGNKYLIY